MSYAILRTSKIKKGNVGAMCQHNARTRETPNADEKAQNVVLLGHSPEKVPDVVNSRIKNIEKRQGKKTRKDAVACVEVLMTASPEFFKESSQEQLKRFSEQSCEWVKSHFGEENVISATLHLDESTPHIHAVVVPETPEHRLSAKNWLGGREKMQEMQDGYAEAVESMGLERGIKGSKAKHMDIKRWYAVGLPKAKEQCLEAIKTAQALKTNIGVAVKQQLSDFSNFLKVKKTQEMQGKDTKDLNISKALELQKQAQKSKELEEQRQERLLAMQRERALRQAEKSKKKKKSKGISL